MWRRELVGGKVGGRPYKGRGVRVIAVGQACREGQHVRTPLPHVPGNKCDARGAWGREGGRVCRVAVGVGVGVRSGFHLDARLQFDGPVMGAILGLQGHARVRLGRRSLAVLVDAMGAFHLTGGLDHQVNPVRALVIDTASANGLRKVVQHCPGHAGQVAQVAVLPLAPEG